MVEFQATDFILCQNHNQPKKIYASRSKEVRNQWGYRELFPFPFKSQSIQYGNVGFILKNLMKIRGIQRQSKRKWTVYYHLDKSMGGLRAANFLGHVSGNHYGDVLINYFRNDGLISIPRIFFIKKRNFLIGSETNRLLTTNYGNQLGGVLLEFHSVLLMLGGKEIFKSRYGTQFDWILLALISSLLRFTGVYWFFSWVVSAFYLVPLGFTGLYDTDKYDMISQYRFFVCVSSSQIMAADSILFSL